jgi:uncharacterized cupin superfamily protein
MTRARSAESIEQFRSTLMPAELRARFGDRAKRRLGDAFGLTQFGVNLTTLPPGAQSALRHWHTREDELVYVLRGELVLVTDDGEQVMRAGDVVGFPGGSQDAHVFVNRSGEVAEYFEVGSRIEDDEAIYPDDDAKWIVEDGRKKVVHKDGTPY